MNNKIDTNKNYIDKINYGSFSEKRNNKDVSIIFSLIWMLKIIFMLILLNLSIGLADAKSLRHYESYCNWVEDVATAIAQNKENGIDEYVLIGKVLETNTDYNQQLIIVPMIDRIFQEDRLSLQEHAWLEHHVCKHTATNIMNFY